MIDILASIRRMYNLTKEPLTLTYIHNNLKKEYKLDSKTIGNKLMILHRNGKIEFVKDRIRPKS